MAQATSSGGLARERHATSIVSFDVANTNVDPMADAPSSSGRTQETGKEEMNIGVSIRYNMHACHSVGLHVLALSIL
jgi:hypothetical protein